MTRHALYTIVDCYPQPGAEVFREFAGAAIGCWIRDDVCATDPHADALIEEKLGAIGWRVARTIERQKVSSKTYDDKSDGRDLFEQALIDGFVANLHRVKRESIGHTDLSDTAVIDALPVVVRSIIRYGGVSLYTSADQQWANGVTATENEFVPIWPNREEAAGWLQDWPGYDLRDLPVEALRSEFLEEINYEDMWVGLGIGKSLLITCHPIWMKRTTGMP